MMRRTRFTGPFLGIISAIVSSLVAARLYGVMRGERVLYDFGWGFWLGMVLFVLWLTGKFSVRQVRSERDDVAESDMHTKEGQFRLTPFEEEDASSFVRADNAELRILKWIQSDPEPFLYLAGRSGTGKTSLILAGVFPRARQEGSRLFYPVAVSTYDDPLNVLAAKLKKPKGIWRQPPAEDNLLVLLKGACSRLRREGKSLLLVFDQFEDLLYAERGELEAVLRAMNEDQIPGLVVMFVYRSEYESQIKALDLPRLEHSKNWELVEPLTESGAAEFLREVIDDEAIRSLILREAKAVDSEVSPYVRPALLNILGSFRGRFVTLPEDAVPGGMAREFLLDVMNQPEIREMSRGVLFGICDSDELRPRSVESLAKKAGLDIESVEKCLHILAAQRVVRCVNRTSGLWSISYDFLVPQVRSILNCEKSHRRAWLKTSMSVGAWFVWILVLTFLVLGFPENRRGDALQALTNIGIGISEDGRADFGGSRGRDDRLLEYAAEHLRHLRSIRSLDLSNTSIGNIDPLAQLDFLRYVDLTGTEVRDLSPLGGLVDLEGLSLRFTKVEDVAALSGLVNLRTLELAGTVVADIDPLGNLESLRSLDLSRTGVRDIRPLMRLMDLESLALSYTQVEDLEPLSGLVDLRTLELAGTVVADIGPLGNLESLRSLDLSRTGVRTIRPLMRLVELDSLALSYTQVEDLEPLNGLVNLRRIELANTIVADIGPLRNLWSLRMLDLSNTRVEDISPLTNLSDLQELRLMNVEFAAEGLEKLKVRLPKLRILVSR